MIRGVKDSNGRVLVEKGDKVKRWKEHFKELLNLENERNKNIRRWGMAARRGVRREEGITNI